jgi:hypothetical protein
MRSTQRSPDQSYRSLGSHRVGTGSQRLLVTPSPTHTRHRTVLPPSLATWSGGSGDRPVPLQASHSSATQNLCGRSATSTIIGDGFAERALMPYADPRLLHAKWAAPHNSSIHCQ